MIDLVKITPDNFINFRDRYDYGPFPTLYYAFHWGSERSVKYYGAKVPISLNSSLGAFYDGRSRYIFGFKKDWETFSQSIFHKILDNANFVKKTFELSRKPENELLSFSKELLGNDPPAKTQIKSLHNRWIELYEEYSFWNIPLWFAASDLLHEFLTKELKDHYNILGTELEILLQTSKPSYVFREELELSKLGLGADLEKALSVQPRDFISKLTEHASRWSFIPYDYFGPELWAAGDFYNRLRKLSKSAALEEKIKLKELYSANLGLQQKKISDKYLLSKKYLRLIKDFQLITDMQDEKKEVCTQAQLALQKVIYKAIGGILDIKPVECIKFSHDELWQALESNDNKSIHAKLPKRLAATTGILEGGKYFLIDGEEAKEIFKRFNSDNSGKLVTGKVANRGKVTGVVKIILSATELDKIQEGDILVTGMTTPDYVVVMRKAAAVITDEGGMTSHAAIVSRELKIPCIVGTKNATKVLKDGDLVEVDADKGIVKLIKKGG